MQFILFLFLLNFFHTLYSDISSFQLIFSSELHHLELLDLCVDPYVLFYLYEKEPHTLSLDSIFMLWKVKTASELFKKACNSLEQTNLLSITSGSV